MVGAFLLAAALVEPGVKAPALDDNAREPENVASSWLKDAVEALLSGKAVDVKQTKALGCSIKWKKGA